MAGGQLYKYQKKRGRKPKAKQTTIVPYKSKRKYNVSLIPRFVPYVLPERYACTMRYNDQFYLTADSTGMPYVIFKYNDLYDPMGTISAFTNNRGIGGHQPYGYDQISTLYDRYCVYKVKVIVSGVSTGSNCKIVMRNNRDTSGSTGNMELDWERGSSKTIYPTSGSGYKTMSMTIYPNKTMGLPLSEYMNDPQYGGVVSGTPSPSTALYLPIHASNDDGGNTTQKYMVDVKLIFSVVWWDKNAFSQS